jgi:FKBP-type peptidyl-prolyl cis-trans isomerase FklB
LQKILKIKLFIMLNKVVLLFLVVGMTMSCNVNNKMEKISLDNEIDSVSYSLGVSAGSYYLKQGFDTINTEAFYLGFKSAIKKLDLQCSEEESNAILKAFFQKASESKYDDVKKEGEDFLKENAEKEGVVTLPSGLQYKIITEGTGAKPQLTDKVKVHYHGTLINGTVFDSSVDRGEPISFPVNGVIAGWTEALQLMPVGSKWELYIPYDLAYGERGAGQQIGPFSTLIFQVELLDIEK